MWRARNLRGVLLRVLRRWRRRPVQITSACAADAILLRPERDCWIALDSDQFLYYWAWLSCGVNVLTAAETAKVEEHIIGCVWCQLEYLDQLQRAMEGAERPSHEHLVALQRLYSGEEAFQFPPNE